MGRPIKHEQELGTEQSMELCCAGTRAKSKSSTSGATTEYNSFSRGQWAQAHSRRHR